MSTQICFWGLLYGEKIKRTSKMNNTSSYAIQKFNKNLVKALNLHYKVKVIAPVRAKSAIITKERSESTEFEYVRYYGKLGRIKLILASFWKTLKGNEKIIIADALNISMTFGMMKAAKLKKNKVILVITDIPDDVLEKKNTVYAKMFKNNLEKADGFVFLTEQANMDYNKEGKLFTIVEGITDVDNSIPYPTNEKICVYAGGLAEKYYIKKMIAAFDAIAKGNEVLYIFGDGECKEYVEAMGKKSKHIKYMGTMENAEILRYEASAELLINPRPDIGDYTKYSFPSKLIEYMNSGTATLVNKLHGVPKEYYDKVYLFSGYSNDDYKESLRKILDIPKCERMKLGQEAKTFIQNRNGISVVAEKMSNLICKLI